MIFIWQNWPSEVDLQSVLKEGTRVEYLSDIDITIFDSPGFSEVGAYDGTVYVRVVAVNIEDVTIDEMTSMVESLMPVLADDT